MRKVLQNLGLLCDEAENGKVAVDLLKQGRNYDLILMDKEMPVMVSSPSLPFHLELTRLESCERGSHIFLLPFFLAWFL